MLHRTRYYIECATSACNRLGSKYNRFLRYTISGVGTFGVDLLLVWLLTEFVGLYYLSSVAIAFLVAVSVNYLISRDWVFRGTRRDFKSGYIFFVFITMSGLALTAGLMALSVEVLGLYYLVARVVVSALVGIYNYMVNLYFNFRVAGAPLD